MLWGPKNLAQFLNSKDHGEFANKVRKSVHLFSFDEWDGPKVIREGGFQRLGMEQSDSDALMEEVRESYMVQDPTWNSQPEYAKDNMQGCLWGIFIADALSAPAHWYYDTRVHFITLKFFQYESVGVIFEKPTQPGCFFIVSRYRKITQKADKCFSLEYFFLEMYVLFQL